MLAILAGISGVLGLLGSLALVGVSGMFGAASGNVVLLGLISLVLAIGALAFAYGAWNLQPWAWTLGVLWGGAAIVLRLVGVVLGNPIFGELIGIAIAAIVLWYLFTPEVKSAFGRT